MDDGTHGGGLQGAYSQQSATLTRPEFIPETYWDPKTGLKPEFGEHYAAARKAYENFEALGERDPEDIQFAVPAGIDVPEGLELKIDETDPRIPILRDIAIKHRLPQDVINALVQIDARSKIDAHKAEIARVAAEKQKLGERGGERISAVTNWARGLLASKEIDQAEFEEIVMTGSSAAGVSILEKLIAKSGTKSAGGGPSQPAGQPIEKRWYTGRGT